MNRAERRQLARAAVPRRNAAGVKASGPKIRELRRTAAHMFKAQPELALRDRVERMGLTLPDAGLLLPGQPSRGSLFQRVKGRLGL